MDTVTAVRNRILTLCEERGISINKLSTISALPPSSIKNILYGKSQNPKLLTIKMILTVWRLPSVSSSTRLSLMRWNRKSNKKYAAPHFCTEAKVGAFV